MKKIVLIVLIVLIGLIGLVCADWTPQDDINLRNIYQIINATNVSVEYLCETNGTCYNLSQFLASGGGGGTTYYAGGDYIYLNGSNYFLFNDTLNNATILAIANANDADTTYTVLSNFTNDVGYVTNSTVNKTTSWEDLIDYPVACPEGTYLTELGDAVICTSISSASYDNLTVDNLNLVSLIIGGKIYSENHTIENNYNFISTSLQNDISPAEQGLASFSTQVYNQTWIDFDGSNDYVQIPDKDELSFNQSGNVSYTISFWMNPATIDFEGTTASGYKEIMGKGTTGDHEFTWRFFNSSMPRAGEIQFVPQSLTGSSASTTRNGESLSADQWYHVVGTINNTYVSIYVDGVLKDSDDYTISLLPGSEPVRIGTKTATGTSFFNGSMDNIIFWNKTLDPKLIRRMFNESDLGSGLGRGIPVLSYHMVRDTDIISTVTTISDFNETMQWIYNNGFTTITYDDYYNWRQGTYLLPEKPILIVFDDGSITVYDNAKPIMDSLDQVGTMFIITNRTNNPDDFAYTQNWTQTQEMLDDGWQIGSHTNTHCNMITNCNTTQNWIDEFNISKELLIENLGITPTTFVYPYSSNNDSSDDLCAEYYTMCHGYGSTDIDTTYQTYLFKNANLTHESGSPIGLKRNSIFNTTTPQQIINLIDFDNGIVARWKLDEGTGSTVYDISGNSINGTTAGATWKDDGIWADLLEGIDYSINKITGAWNLLNQHLDRTGVNISYNYNDLDVSFGSGISSLIFSPYHYYSQDVWPENQTYSIGAFNITNNGTGIASTIGIKVNDTQTGWTMECNNATTESWINLNTTYQTIYSGLAINESFQTWCRMDLNNPSSAWNAQVLFNITN